MNISSNLIASQVSNRNFILPQIPIHHPKTLAFKDFWGTQVKRIREGLWASNRWMPGRLYYYSNFHKIMLNKSKTSTQKVFALPMLRDIEWELFYHIEETRGFSGFDDDEEFTCLRDFQDCSTDEERDILRKTYPEIWSELHSRYKEYMPAREYMRMIHPYEKGVPMYRNQAKNFLWMSGRGLGKSFIISGILAHEWIFDGKNPIHKYTDPEDIAAYKTMKTSVILGAGDTRKATETMKKVADAIRFYPGKYETNDKVYPAPFYKQYSGNFETEVKATFKKKEGNFWNKAAGSQSKMRAMALGDNPFAAQGDRNNIIIFEEIGHFKNPLKSYHALVHNMIKDGVYKFGSWIAVGCVTGNTNVWTHSGELKKIKNLKKEDGILGYDGGGVKNQEIKFFKEPAKKECYRITTDSGEQIEASWDHPFLSAIREPKINFLGQRRRVRFRNPTELKVGDHLLKINEVNKFGNTTYEDARLLGLLIGDGYYGNKKEPTISCGEDEIINFIKDNYDFKIKKEFIQKSNGRLFTELTIKSGVKNLLKDLNMIGQSKENKRLPSNIHEFDKLSLSNLLGGYFDADGNVVAPQGKKNGRIVLTSVVQELLIQVKYQLLKFGIHCNIIKENRNTIPEEKYKGQKNHIYRLYISKYNDVKAFHKNIELLCNHKTENIKKILEKKTNRKFGKIEKGFFEATNSGKGTGFMGVEVNNVAYETITKIEWIGEEIVYSMNAEYTHTYLANNFITHNTGGDMDSGTLDAQYMFFNPESFDLLTFQDTWENKGKIAYFMPSWMGLNYLRNENGIIDEEKARLDLDKDLEKSRITKDRATYEKELTYKARVPSEVFLMTDGNVFPVVELKQHLIDLEKQNVFDIIEKPVELSYSQNGLNGIDYKILEKGQAQPINQYPWPDGNPQEGNVVIYEFPITDKETGQVPDDLYVIGHDPYRTNSEKGSFAATVVMKTSKYSHIYGHNEIVAVYYGRPFEGRDASNETLLKMAMFYNAKVMFENNVGNVKDFFEKRKRLDLLYRRPTAVLTNKDSTRTDATQFDYGYPLSNQKVKSEVLQYIKTWLLEERGLESTTKQVVTYDKRGNKKILEYTEHNREKEGEQKIIRNLNRIWDRRLLQELISYNLEGNFDAVHGLAGAVIAMEEIHKKKTQSLFIKEQSSELDFIINNKKLFPRKNIAFEKTRTKDEYI